MVDEMVQPSKSNTLIGISSLGDSNNLSSTQVVLDPILHNFLRRADNNRGWRSAPIGAYRLNNCKGLAVFWAWGIELVDLSGNNDNLASRAADSDSGLVHIVDVFCASNSILGEGILIFDEEGF